MAIHLGRVKFFISGEKGEKGTGYGFIFDLGLDGKNTEKDEVFFNIGNLWLVRPSDDNREVHMYTVISRKEELNKVPRQPRAGDIVAFRREPGPRWGKDYARGVAYANDYKGVYLGLDNWRLKEREEATWMSDDSIKL